MSEPKDLGIPLWVSLIPGAVGDDGLTRWERKWLAMQAERDFRRPPSKESREALRKWRETKEDKK